MIEDTFINIKLFYNFFIALKYFDSKPSLLLLGHIMKRCFLNVSDCMFNSAGERVHRNSLAMLCSFNCRFGCKNNSRTLQRGYFNNLTSKLTRKLCRVNLVSVFLYNVHHVDCNNNGDSKLCKLRCKIKVSLKVCAVNNIKYCVRTLADKIISRNNFFECVRRKRVYTRKVGNCYTGMLLKLTLFFLNRNTGPVSDKLVGTGQCVEKRCFTAVWVTCKRNSDIHYLFLSFKITQPQSFPRQPYEVKARSRGQ